VNGFLPDDEVLGKAFDLRLLRRLLPFARPYARLFAASLGILLGLYALNVVGPLLWRWIVDGPITEAFEAARTTTEAAPAGAAAEAGDTESIGRELLRLVLLYGAVQLALLGLRYVHAILTVHTGQKVILDIRQAVFAHLQRLPLSFFDRNPAGRLVTRVTSDVEALNELFTTGLVLFFYDVLMVLGVMAVLFWLHAGLATLTLVLLPLLVVASAIFRGRVRTGYREVRRALSAVSSFLGESLSGATPIRVHGQEARMAARFARRNEALRKAHVKTVHSFAAFFPVVELVNAIILGATLWYGGSLILGDAFTIGRFFQYYFYLQLVFDPLRELSEKFNVFQAAMAASERIFRVLDEPPGPPVPVTPWRPEGAERGAAVVRGDVAFEDVTFAYEEGRPVLRGIDLRVRAGERVALVGATGAGKTTIAALLLRFYDPGTGRVTIDGCDLRDWDAVALRRAVGVVLQDVFLFAGSIRENLRLRDASIPDDRIREAVRAAHLEGLVGRLPGGLEHVLSERGQNLSSGERQLLSLARAIAVDPPILILDEATSSVDPGTETHIQDALHRLLENRTALIIAHRLTTLTLADRIVVLHHGEVREQGTHAELLRRGGLYAKLWELQVLSRKNGGTPVDK